MRDSDRRGRDSRARPRFVTWRAVALGAVLLPINTLWLTWNVWYQQHITGGSSLFHTTVFILALLLGLNALLGRRWPRARLAPGELLVVYIMLTFGTTMCASGWDWMANLPTYLTYPFRHATESNRWAVNLLPHLPSWLVVEDPVAVIGFWEGRMCPYQRQVLEAWLGPTLWWTSFVAALVWVFLCVSSLFRRRWVEEEKMAFPLVHVPTAMVEPGGQLWRARAFQLGAAVTAGIVLLDFVSSFVPSVPTFAFSFDYGQYISHMRPWSGIRQPWFWFEPFLIGISYLIPVDLLFSLWVFTLLAKVQQVLTIHFGWNTHTWSGPPYIDAQSFGALLALVGSALWLDRRYLSALLRGALLGRGPLGDREEALGHRLALAGAVAGVGYLMWFVLRMGMALGAAAAFLGLFVLISVTLARIRAQLGPPHHEFMLAGPGNMLMLTAGVRAFDPPTHAAFTLLEPFTVSQRGNPAPLTIEALKMSERERTLRGLAVPIMAAAVVGSLALFWSNLHLNYANGASIRSHMAPVFRARGDFSALDQRLTQPTGTDWWATGAIGGGALLCAVLMALKLHFPGFPLHPVALPVSIGSGIEGTVAAVFLAWLAKAIVLRWGGRGTYRLSFQVALGVIVGSACAGCLVWLARQALGITVSG